MPIIKKYRKHLSNGLCGSCGARPPKKGRVHCYKCIAGRKRRIAEKKRLGLCLHCSAPVEIENNTNRFRCIKCQIKYRVRRKGLSESEAQRAREALRIFDGKCQCCGATGPGGARNFHLDHKNDKFRGILCKDCNLTLGIVRDSEERLLALIMYLKNRCQKIN